MHRSKRKRNVIIFSLVGILLCMVVGYAAFNTKLEIKGTSKVTSNWDIRITNVTDGTPTGGAENTVAPKWTNLTASMEANLYDKGDAMEYDVTIENKGTLDAKLNDILTNLENENNEAVLITFSGYTKGEVLKAGGSKLVHVKIAYNPEYEGGETSSEVEINFDYGQDNKSEDAPKTYLLTYDYKTNGGERADSEGEYLISGSNVDLSNQAYKTSYRFVGWNTDKNAKVGLTSYQMEEEATTLYAIYSKDLKVTYEKGSNIESIGKTEDACTIYNNETSCEVTLPSITPNEGYIVDGWYNENNKVGSPNDKYSLKSNITLTSKAKQNAYTVTYDYKTNGGTSSTKTTDKVNYGESIDLSPTATKEGWTFIGWNTNKDATTKLSSLTMGKSNVTLYAIYSKEVTANFNANGATSIGSTLQSCTLYNTNTSCNITTPSITRSGFTITGWGTSSSATTAAVKVNSTLSLSSNATYYAVTSKTVTVTYSKGSNVSAIGSTSGTCTIRNSATNCSITLPSITAASTYVTDGWYSGSTRVGSAGAKYTVSNNTTLTAQVKADNITLSMSTTNATNSITVVANASATSGIVKYEFSKDGGKTWINGGTNKTYTFNGLTQGTSYNIQVRVTSNSGKTSTSSKTVTTASLAKPTFSETNEGEVVITYPSGCTNGKTCSYKNNNGNAITVTTNTISYVGSDGTVVATVTDGTNTVSSSYTVIRKNLYVSLSGSDTTGYGTKNKPYATLTKAYNSATNSITATIYAMNNITQTDTTNMDDDKDIILTSYSNNDSINSFIRGSNLTGYMINQTTGTLTLKNITIDGNNVQAHYGLISIGSSTINVNTGSTIKNAKSTESNGGAIRIEDSTNGILNLNGGTISNNSAPGGGGIQCGITAQININSGTITNNSATKDYGGGIYATGTINLRGGNISNNNAIERGGGIAGRDLLMNVYGGNLNGNTASNSAAKLYNNINIAGASYIDKYEGTTRISSVTNNHSWRITNQNSGKVMEIPGAQLYNGRSLQQYTWNNSGAQRWYLLPNHIINGEIYYVFMSSLSNQYVIDVYGQPNDITTSHAVEIYEYFDEADFYWYITLNDGWFNIKNKVKDYCLEVAGGSTNDNAAIQLYTCNNTGAQKWSITGE